MSDSVRIRSFSLFIDPFFSSVVYWAQRLYVSWTNDVGNSRAAAQGILILEYIREKLCLCSR